MIDWPAFANWIITGLLGVLFGTASGWVTYRYQRRQDDIKWEREKELRREDWQREQEKMKQQWEREQAQLRQQWEHEMSLRALEVDEQKRSRFREELLKGTDDPLKAIADLQRAHIELRAMFSDNAHTFSRLREQTFNSMLDEFGWSRSLELLARRLAHEPTLRSELHNNLTEDLKNSRRDNASMIILVGIILMIVNLAAILILKQWIFALILVAAPILILIGIVIFFFWPSHIRRD